MANSKPAPRVFVRPAGFNRGFTAAPHGGRFAAVVHGGRVALFSVAPIALAGLGNGPHFVEVTGLNDAGFYQNDPVFGVDAVVTVSQTWTVNTSLPGLRINEVLAANSGGFVYSNTTPDAIELYNLFITEYGSDAKLAVLQKGDPKTKTNPDPKKYAERVGYLNDAYDALGTTYYSFFTYQKAAETDRKSTRLNSSHRT